MCNRSQRGYSEGITYNAEMVFPSDECRSHFMELLEQTRDAYNECAKIIYDNNIPLDIKSVHNAIYARIRKGYPKLTSNAVIALYRGAFLCRTFSVA